MIRDFLSSKIRAALQALVDDGALAGASLPPAEVQDTKSAEHGDFATNWALAAAKPLGRNPRELGEALAEELRKDAGFAKVEVAGPGFVNLTLTAEALARVVGPAVASASLAVLESDSHFARSRAERPLKINVEFVSVNPNGPITIGSGRGAAYGSTLCNVLQAAGHTVWREYYINDGTNSEQMRLFAESVEALSKGQPLPANGYKGDYVEAVAKQVGDCKDLRKEVERIMINAQRDSLTAFQTHFDCWFSEQSLHDNGVVSEWLSRLQHTGVADEDPYQTVIVKGKGGEVLETNRVEQPTDEDDAAGTGKTLWLRSTKFSDDKDRVLIRKDGRPTYIASDIAYHADKFNRPPDADKLITVLGPDHHGYIGRLQAVVAGVLSCEAKDAGKPISDEEALALAKEKLEVLIFQLVRFMKDGKPAPMRKRDGNIYALIDLVKEIGQHAAPDADEEEQTRIGVDVTRFFYLMRSHDTTFDFDLDLAEKQSDENPVFYAQYAHARICSVLDKAQEAGFDTSAPARPAPQELHAAERALILKIADLPHEVRRCAEDYGVNRLTTYAVELARTYHSFYDNCRVVQPDQPDLSRWRVALCVATRTSLKAAFDLLGISAPVRMERAS